MMRIQDTGLARLHVQNRNLLHSSDAAVRLLGPEFLFGSLVAR